MEVSSVILEILFTMYLENLYALIWSFSDYDFSASFDMKLHIIGYLGSYDSALRCGHYVTMLDGYGNEL